MFKKMKIKAHKTLILLVMISFNVVAEKFEAIEVYSQDDLNKLIVENKHLQKIKADQCQLVEDIEAHALKIKEPAYTYLWGDMLAWGVCVKSNPELGIYYIKKSAQQGLLPALEQLGRYYQHGILVEKNPEKAIIYYREAALQGFINAQFNYIDMLIQGFGSPLDYEDAYHALFISVIKNKKKHRRAEHLLKKLEKRMPEYAINNAKRG